MNNKKRLHSGAKMRSREDYFGSYTGTCSDDTSAQPVQDADDL